MTQSEKQRWEQVRARGRDRFILHQGLLRWGVPSGVVVMLFAFLYRLFTDAPAKPIWELAVNWAFMTLGVGGSMGVIHWQKHERDYQKPTGDDNV